MLVKIGNDYIEAETLTIYSDAAVNITINSDLEGTQRIATVKESK